MTITGTLALMPKARGMFAKRIREAEYEELLRRRTVPEVAMLLKQHPYFAGSLGTLSTLEPHRGQIEELLGMDIFTKYTALLQYEFGDNNFSAYYLRECEIRQVLQALHMLSIGLVGAYLNQIPSYLVGKTDIDLFALGQATSFEEILEVTRGTPYYKVLRAHFLAGPALHNLPAVEADLLRCHYAILFEQIDQILSPRERESVRELFLQEVEAYNLALLLRVKTYFPTLYSSAELLTLLLPYSWHIGKQRLQALAEAENSDAVFALLGAIPSFCYTGPPTPEGLAVAEDRRIYHHARHVLHLTSSPCATLAAFLILAKLERENVVNVIEGVRYGFAPEAIRAMLCY